MSLSDCIKCWDTPCTCGYEGYALIRFPVDKEKGQKILEQYTKEIKDFEGRIEQEYKKSIKKKK